MKESAGGKRDRKGKSEIGRCRQGERKREGREKERGNTKKKDTRKKKGQGKEEAGSWRRELRTWVQAREQPRHRRHPCAAPLLLAVRPPSPRP
eukprot:6847-Rhodomonas_salina.1